MAAAPVKPVAAAPATAKGPAPWEDDRGVAGQGQAQARRGAAEPALPQQTIQNDDARHDGEQDSADYGELPPWVTEFSDDSAAAPATSAPAPAAVSAAVPARPVVAAPPPRPQVLVPVPGLDWDGNWPAVAAVLPLRGVAQQLAVQAELIECQHDGHTTVFKLRVPIDTWRSSANVEKLAAALSERFGRKVQVETELGAVWYTASAEAQAFREACQRQAEEVVANDPFVLSLMRDFGATVVPGSISPAIAPTPAAG